jgi:hypothetical protein
MRTILFVVLLTATSAQAGLVEGLAPLSERAAKVAINAASHQARQCLIDKVWDAAGDEGLIAQAPSLCWEEIHQLMKILDKYRGSGAGAFISGMLYRSVLPQAIKDKIEE